MHRIFTSFAIISIAVSENFLSSWENMTLMDLHYHNTLKRFVHNNESYHNLTYEEIYKIYHAAELIPYIMHEPPLRLCRIKFPEFTVHIGQIVFLRQIVHRPTVTWKAKPNALYTLYVGGSGLKIKDSQVSDSDDYEYVRRQWHQWVVINIPGDNVTAGQHIFPYLPPIMPARLEYSDYYTYYIFKQKRKLNITVPEGGFDMDTLTPVMNFTRVHNLGYPVAGNFLRMEWLLQTTPSSIEYQMDDEVKEKLKKQNKLMERRWKLPGY